MVLQDLVTGEALWQAQEEPQIEKMILQQSHPAAERASPCHESEASQILTCSHLRTGAPKQTLAALLQALRSRDRDYRCSPKGIPAFHSIKILAYIFSRRATVVLDYRNHQSGESRHNATTWLPVFTFGLFHDASAKHSRALDGVFSF